jgi:N utilization substance protein B
VSTNTVPMPDDEGPIERIGDLEVRRTSGDIQKHADLSTRSKARKQALDILFEADLMGTDPLEVLAARPSVFINPVRPFAADLVRGVAATQAGLDSVLADCLSEGWTLDRMPRVDRILARLGTFEILHTDTPNPAVISEAIELSEEFSTDDSAPFLNGLLSAVISHGPARVEDLPSDDAIPSSSLEPHEDCEQSLNEGDDVEAIPSGADSALSPAEADNGDATSGNAGDLENSANSVDLTGGEHSTSEDYELDTDLHKTDATGD